MGDMNDKEPLQPGIDNSTNTFKERDMPGVTSSHSSTAEFGYEELSNGLSCPTCQGTGKIPRGQEDDLVALIPYRDERLKPRRTALHVCIAVFVCMAVAGVLCAFLIPRPISFVDDHVDTIKADLNITNNFLNLKLMNFFNVSNHNFLSLDITGASTQVVSTFYGHVINKQDKVAIDISIPLRSENSLKIPVNVTVHNEDFPLDYCNPSGPTHGIYMIFTTTISYHFMFRDSESTIMHYQLVNCAMPKRRYDSELTKRSAETGFGTNKLTHSDVRRNNFPSFDTQDFR